MSKSKASQPEQPTEQPAMQEPKPGVNCSGLAVDEKGNQQRLYHTPFEQPLGPHLEKHLGPCATVMRAPLLGCHVYVFPPAPEIEGQNYWKLVTMGLSGFQMPTEKGAEHLGRIELMMYLPADSDPKALNADELGPENFAHSLLVSYADMCMMNNSWFKHNDGVGGNMFTGQEPLFEGSAFASAMLRHPTHMPVEFFHPRWRNEATGEETQVNLLCVVPLSMAEYKFRTENNSEELFKRMCASNGGDAGKALVVDVNRGSYLTNSGGKKKKSKKNKNKNKNKKNQQAEE